MASKNVPFCVGGYDRKEVVCNGDNESEDEVERKACAWRDRCSAFKAFISDRNVSSFDYVEIITNDDDTFSGVPIKGYEHFITMCNAQKKRYGIKNGIITKKPGKPHYLKKRKISKRTRNASAKALKKLASLRRKELNILFQHFKTHLIENLEGFKFVHPKGIIKPGMLYIVDRSNTSKYIAIYYKKPGVIGTLIAQLVFRPLNIAFDIELPVEPTGFAGINKHVMKKIHPIPTKNNRFGCVCRNMKKEGVALVAQTIAHLVRIGRIKLTLT